MHDVQANDKTNAYNDRAKTNDIANCENEELNLQSARNMLFDLQDQLDGMRATLGKVTAFMNQQMGKDGEWNDKPQ